MAKKVADVRETVEAGRRDPSSVFPALRNLAASKDWQDREVAATAVVEISKKHPSPVIAEMLRWADEADANVRRCASEGLRQVARKDPSLIVPVLDKLKADADPYVRKSVANVLRNAGNYHPKFVLDLCRAWSRKHNSHTEWIVKDGLRKLKASDPESVSAILND